MLGEKILAKVQSHFNGEIVVVRTLEGVRLVVDGLTQSGYILERIWKTVFRKIKNDDLYDVKNVLILGLGGGSAAVLISKIWPGARIVGIDIDPTIVKLGKKYLGLGGISRLTFIEADAGTWVKRKHRKKFDLILVDLFLGRTVANEFSRRDFVLAVKNLAKKGGVIVFNRVEFQWNREDIKNFSQLLRREFDMTVTIRPEANIVFICYC